MNEQQHTGWTAGHIAFGDFAPGMVHYTDNVLFDEVWEREGLSKRDRSLITVAALTAMGKTDQLRFHLATRGPTVSPTTNYRKHFCT